MFRTLLFSMAAAVLVSACGRSPGDGNAPSRPEPANEVRVETPAPRSLAYKIGIEGMT